MKAALIAKIAAGTLAAGAAVAVGAVLLWPDGDPVAGQPQAWIDDPLHGSSVPSGTLHVVAHAADPAGLAAVEFAVDDAVQEVQDVPGGPPFWLASFDWAAGQPGTVVLRVRARSTTGTWGLPAFTTVHIGGPTSTPTPTESPTTPASTPTPSTTPTTTSTPPPPPPPPTTQPSPITHTFCVELVAPDLAAPSHRSVVRTVTPTLQWRYGGTCTPDGFEVQVARNRAMTEIERSGTTVGSTTQWTVGPALADCTTYYWRVRAVTGRIQGPWSDVYAFDVAAGRCP